MPPPQMVSLQTPPQQTQFAHATLQLTPPSQAPPLKHMTPLPKEVKKPPVAAGKKRFAELLNVEELKTLEEAQVPKRLRTKQATHWAVRVFDEWVTSRNTVACNMFSCPSDLLKKPYPPAVLDQWLAAFIMEVRKADRTHYSPDSLQCLVAGVQRYLRENLGRAAPNIVDK